MPRCLVALLPCCLVSSLPCCLVALLPRFPIGLVVIGPQLSGSPVLMAWQTEVLKTKGSLTGNEVWGKTTQAYKRTWKQTAIFFQARFSFTVILWNNFAQINGWATWLQLFKQSAQSMVAQSMVVVKILDPLLPPKLCPSLSTVEGQLLCLHL